MNTADTKPREEQITRRLPSRPNRALGFVLRLPSYLYRYRLGGLLGHRFLLLTHRGRKSGLTRRTPLEVLHYDPRSRESVVLSAWGKKADWYRNIEASLALEVETGGDCYPPAVRFLTTEEAYAVITEYAIRHPLAARVLERVFGYPVTRSAACRKAFTGSVALVAFRPQGKRSARRLDDLLTPLHSYVGRFLAKFACYCSRANDGISQRLTRNVSRLPAISLRFWVVRNWVNASLSTGRRRAIM